MRSAAVILVALAATVSAIPPAGYHGLHYAAPFYGHGYISSDLLQTQLSVDARGVHRDLSHLAGAQITNSLNAHNAALSDNAALINAENVQAIQNARQIAANRINQAAAIGVVNGIASRATANNIAIQTAQRAFAVGPAVIPGAYYGSGIGYGGYGLGAHGYGGLGGHGYALGGYHG